MILQEHHSKDEEVQLFHLSKSQSSIGNSLKVSNQRAMASNILISVIKTGKVVYPDFPESPSGIMTNKDLFHLIVNLT
jgi:hypothetical protein